jgi:serine/threonine-protein kinase
MKRRAIASLLAAAIQLLLACKANAVGGAFESIQELGKATSPDGKSSQSYVERGARKEQAGDFAGAIADYSAAIVIEPKSPVAHYYRAILYDALGRFKEAIADLDIVIKDSPKSVGAYLVRGDAHADLGHAKEAIADYDKAIECATNSTEGDLARAKAFLGKGDYARAATLYDQARRRGPRDDNALNGFAWFSATCPERSVRNGPEAVKAATKACELTKWKDGGVIDTLAAAYAETGDFNQAIKYQMQALGIRPPAAPDSLAEMRKHLRAYQAHKPFHEEPKLRKARN